MSRFSIGSNVLPPQMGLPPSFGGPTPAGSCFHSLSYSLFLFNRFSNAAVCNATTSFQSRYAFSLVTIATNVTFNILGNGMMSQVSLAQGFNALPPMPNYPQVSAAFTMPMMSAAPPTMSGPDVVKFDLTNIGPPPVPMEQQIDPTEMLFRARADLYRRDLSEIRAIPDLMKYSKSFDFLPPILIDCV